MRHRRQARRPTARREHRRSAQERQDRLPDLHVHLRDRTDHRSAGRAAQVVRQLRAGCRPLVRPRLDFAPLPKVVVSTLTRRPPVASRRSPHAAAPVIRSHRPGQGGTRRPAGPQPVKRSARQPRPPATASDPPRQPPRSPRRPPRSPRRPPRSGERAGRDVERVPCRGGAPLERTELLLQGLDRDHRVVAGLQALERGLQRGQFGLGRGARPVVLEGEVTRGRSRASAASSAPRPAMPSRRNAVAPLTSVGVGIRLSRTRAMTQARAAPCAGQRRTAARATPGQHHRHRQRRQQRGRGPSSHRRSTPSSRSSSSIVALESTWWIVAMPSSRPAPG